MPDLPSEPWLVFVSPPWDLFVDGSDELMSLQSFALEIREALKSNGIGSLKLDDDLLAGNPGFLAKLGDIYHQSGGSNMADSPEKGVVDSNLRVFGTDNLYVVGAGTFPTTSNANTTFTTVGNATGSTTGS